MRRIRDRLTYANVIATLALFLVLSGGTAVALSGSNTVFSDDIVDGAVKSQDLAPPQRAAGAVFARINTLGDATSFGPVSGTAETVYVEGEATDISPRAQIVARDFIVSLRPDNPPNLTCSPANPPCSRRFVLRDDGVDTPVACTITGTQRSCNAGTRSALIAPGSKLSIKHSRQGNTTQSDALIGWRASTP